MAGKLQCPGNGGAFFPKRCGIVPGVSAREVAIDRPGRRMRRESKYERRPLMSRGGIEGRQSKGREAHVKQRQLPTISRDDRLHTRDNKSISQMIVGKAFAQLNIVRLHFFLIQRQKTDPLFI